MTPGEPATRMAINSHAMTISACGCGLRPGKHSVITMIKDNAKMRTAALPGVLADPVLNRGVAFSAADREALGLTGRLPAAVLTLEEQAERAYRQL